MAKNPSKIHTKDIQDIITKLTYVCDNYVSILSRTTGISRTTVSKFFNDQKISPMNQEKIFDAACRIILTERETSQNREQMVKQIRQNP